MERCHDAYGHAIWDFHCKGYGYEIVERDDGYIDYSSGPPAYFRPIQGLAKSSKKGGPIRQWSGSGYRLRCR
jgi:hypothetical protein